MERRLAGFTRLLEIMDTLRANCPWDKAQTLDSLRYLTIEETYELSDAILENKLQEMKGELGDLLLHIVFYAKIAEEKGAFEIGDVLEGINEKLVHRHPHIYGDVVAADSQTVKENWERIKLKSGKRSVLQGVPLSLPAMVKAYRIQEKARGVGFDWEEPHQVLDKVREELGELEREVTANPDPSRVEAEFGDLLFALVNYSRFIGVNPEDALERTNRKFIRRFQYLEDKAREKGKSLAEMSLAEMDVFWEEAKKGEG